MSALIFVALAIAWAVYLIPQALKHHEASDAARNVDRFSRRMRVLARREPVDRKTARLVVTTGRPAPSVEASVPAATAAGVTVPASDDVRRVGGSQAARRRRRVLGTILALLLAVGVATGVGYLPMLSLAGPGGLLVVWLVMCRLMVRQERAVPSRRRLPVTGVAEVLDDPLVAGPATEEIAAVDDELLDEVPIPAAAPVAGAWDPVPVTLPTYVDKEPAARRSVRTIDLDGTGVWTSGRSAVDSALAREADAAARTARQSGSNREQKPGPERRASGS